MRSGRLLRILLFCYVKAKSLHVLFHFDLVFFDAKAICICTLCKDREASGTKPIQLSIFFIIKNLIVGWSFVLLLSMMCAAWLCTICLLQQVFIKFSFSLTMWTMG